MAYAKVLKPGETEENQLDQTGSAAPADEAGSGAGITAAPTGVPPPVAGGQQAGTGFVNLSHLLELNRNAGAQKAQGLIQQQQQNLQNTQGALKTTQNDFADQVRRGAGTYNQRYDNAGVAGNTAGLTKLANGAAYRGPSSIGETESGKNFATQEAAAQKQAGDSLSESGLSDYFAQQSGQQPGSTANNLDTLYASQGAGGQIADINNGFTQINSALDTNSRNGVAAAQQASSDAQNKYNQLATQAQGAETKNRHAARAAELDKEMQANRDAQKQTELAYSKAKMDAEDRRRIAAAQAEDARRANENNVFNKIGGFLGGLGKKTDQGRGY